MENLTEIQFAHKLINIINVHEYYVLHATLGIDDNLVTLVESNAY